jgi:hypothetical protein
VIDVIASYTAETQSSGDIVAAAEMILIDAIFDDIVRDLIHVGTVTSNPANDSADPAPPGYGGSACERVAPRRDIGCCIRSPPQDFHRKRAHGAKAEGSLTKPGA